MSARAVITTYEWRPLVVNQAYDGVTFTADHLRALADLNQRHQGKYFTLGARRLTCTGWVGVVEVPGLTLEILPKTEALPDGAERWRRVLLEILRATGQLPTSISVAALATRPLRLLDVYVRLLLRECEGLLHAGLVKQYRLTEGNRPALKGQLRFAEHLRYNLVHQERFYVRHQTYDPNTPLNALLRMALQLVTEVVTNAALRSRAATLLLAWPATSVVPVPATFPRLGRRTLRYRPALELALLLLRRLHPDVRAGRTEAVALLFEMHRLFETYVARQLQRAARHWSGVVVKTQDSADFWGNVTIRPDIVVSRDSQDSRDKQVVVLDTKWKVPKNDRPSADDLQQLYAYCHLWHAPEGWLVYPATRLQKDTMKDFTASDFVTGGQRLQGRLFFAPVLTEDGSLNPNFGSELLHAVLLRPAVD